MSGKKYPRFSNKGKKPHNTQARCVCCREIGTMKVTIQTNWFRGDDLIMWCCDRKHSALNMVEAAYRTRREGVEY